MLSICSLSCDEGVRFFLMQWYKEEPYPRCRLAQRIQGKRKRMPGEGIR
jgi:hypothetical protein